MGEYSLLLLNLVGKYSLLFLLLVGKENSLTFISKVNICPQEIAIMVYYCGMKREILGFPRPVPRDFPRDWPRKTQYFPIYSTIVSF